MKSYNYYDDDDEIEEELSARSSSAIIDVIKDNVSDILHGNIPSALENLSGRKKLMAKLTAFAILLLVVLIAVLIFAHSINANNDKLDTYNKDAAAVCTDYIGKYGAIKWESLDSAIYGENQARLTGLCYARQMDFDNDGTDELMLCYYDNGKYYLEVWGYKDKEFTTLYNHRSCCTNKSKDGDWVGFYHKNGKYYICQSESSDAESVELFGLKGDEFRAVSSCDYDYKNDIYAVKGKINAHDFETIKLSAFRKSKGDVYVDLVTSNIDAFGNVSAAIMNNKKSSSQLMKEAYSDIITSRIEKYGDPKISVDDDGNNYIDGVALVRQIDFDGDGVKELFIAYRKSKMYTKYDYSMGENITYYMPIYAMEVYNWNGTVAKRIFTKDSVSTLLDDTQCFYVCFTRGNKKIDICNNVYTFENGYSYVASSKIYRLKKEKFDTIFSAKLKNDYGYRSYTIDGERVYGSSFDQKGYRVPLFMNDDGDYDKSSFDIIYLSKRGVGNMNTVLNDTVTEIKALNSGYNPSGED